MTSSTEYIDVIGRGKKRGKKEEKEKKTPTAKQKKEASTISKLKEEAMEVVNTLPPDVIAAREEGDENKLRESE